jgi:hypothetical protein
MSGMNCGDFEGALIELARNGPESASVAAHLESCGACRATLRSQRRLNAATGILAAEAAQFSAPPRLESALLAEFELAIGYRRRRFVYGVLGGAVAASLGVVWWLAHPPAPKVSITAVATAVPQSVQPVPAVMESPPRKRSKRVVRAATEPEQPFIAIPYTLPLEPWERTEVVRMEMPVAALIAAGLPMGMMDPAARARTDVLVGQDGRARAVRLISISIPN